MNGDVVVERRIIRWELVGEDVECGGDDDVEVWCGRKWKSSKFMRT
jgi:hypothetical protein